MQKKRGCPTCRSWGQSAPSSVCQKGRRRHHHLHPPRRFHLSHTEHCCLTAAGRAEREEVTMEEKKKVMKKADKKAVSHKSYREYEALLWPQSSPTCSALGG